MPTELSARPFQLPGALRAGGRPLERALGITALNGIYARSAGPGGPAAFMERALADLGVSIEVEGGARIPASGPCVVVANHPHGLLDGLALGAVLGAARPDVKLLASHLLARVPELAAMVIPIDPFGGPEAARDNRRQLVQALRWLERGGLVALFPAGEVSHLDLRARAVLDPAWSPLAAWLARRAAAPVVPLFLAGRNSAFFQLAGLVHPRLRTALLGRELFRKKDSHLKLRVGRPVPPERLADWACDREATGALRSRTYLLARREAHVASPQAQEPLHPPVDPAALEQEVQALPPGALLLESGDFAVHLARARQIPRVLTEIGRLREVTFRAVGEGTGRALDLDRYDQAYLHLFVWSRSRRAVIGAYRLGASDDLGLQGLYTRTLFDYQRPFLEAIGPALELGRAFVRPEDQRAHAPLGLLWRGIGRFLAANPRYRRLFGPCSVSGRNDEGARRLVIAHLETRLDPHLASLVRPLRPPERRALPVTPETLRDGDAVSELIAELEPDGAGLPVLVRQYMRLGARYVCASVDPAFGGSLDGLIVLDLANADHRLLARTLGKAEAGALLAGQRPLRRAA